MEAKHFKFCYIFSYLTMITNKILHILAADIIFMSWTTVRGSHLTFLSELIHLCPAGLNWQV